MDRVLRVRGYIFFKFLPHQPRIDKNYQTLKKIEGLIIFRTCLKLYGWISVLKNDILKPIEKQFDRTPQFSTKTPQTMKFCSSLISL